MIYIFTILSAFLRVLGFIEWAERIVRLYKIDKLKEENEAINKAPIDNKELLNDLDKGNL